MRTNLIIVNGYGGSGKDTFVEFCSKYRNNQCCHLSWVDHVKRKAKALGWDGTKTKENRLALSKLMEAMELFNDYPFQRLTLDIGDMAIIPTMMYIFIDIRNPKNIKRVVDKYRDVYNVYTVKIERENIVVDSNPEDASVNDYNYDVTIENNADIKSLEILAKKFIDYIDERNN